MSRGKVLRTVTLLLRALQKTNTTLWKLTLPAVLAAVASLCEGAALALTLPALQLLLSHAAGKSQEALTLPSWLQSFIPQSQREQLIFIVSCMLVATLVKLSTSYFSSLLTVYQVKQFAHRLRYLLYERYLSFGKLFFDGNSLGQQQQVLTTYVSVISLTLSSFQMGLYACCTTAVYFVILFSLSWKLSVVVLLVFPVLHFALKRLIDRIVDASAAYTEAYNQLGRRIVNALSAVPLIKSYCNEYYELKNFERLSAQVAVHEYSIERKNLLVGPLQEFILVCFLVLFAAMIGVLDQLGGGATLAEYVVYLLVLKRAATLFGVFNSLRSSLASISGPFDELMRLFNDSGKHFVADGTRTFHGLRDEIRINNLNFSFSSGVPALSQVAMTIRRGTVMGVVGESGAGKSTLMNLIMRFYDPPPNTIIVDGVDIREYTLSSWREKCALVTQEAFIFHGTLRENLVYGIQRSVTEQEIARALEQAQLLKLVEKLPEGLESKVGERGFQLSGGERQRLSIARAFLKSAEILLLDEAVSALDSVTEKEVHRALDLLIEGRTAIVIAHRMSSICFADSVVVLEKGAILEEGSISELLAKRGRFYEYWKSQGMTEIEEHERTSRILQ